jgi:hypothetical protein
MEGDCCENSALYRICTLLFAEAARLGVGTAAHVPAPVPELDLTDLESRELESEMIDLQMQQMQLELGF